MLLYIHRYYSKIIDIQKMSFFINKFMYISDISKKRPTRKRL